MTHKEFIEDLEKVSGIQYSKEAEKFFYTTISNQFKAYKKSHEKLKTYNEAHRALHSN